MAANRLQDASEGRRSPVSHRVRRCRARTHAQAFIVTALMLSLIAGCASQDRESVHDEPRPHSTESAAALPADDLDEASPAMASAATALHAAAPPSMTAHFIDVGQANATLLEFPCGAVLIDAGAADPAATAALVAYLESFFSTQRPDLDRTLEAVFVTHPRIDHARALRSIAEGFTVRHYVDNGATTGSGGARVRWMRTNASRLGFDVEEVWDERITGLLPHRDGLTSGSIDPVDCQRCDPRIRVLSGQLATDPGWGSGEFEDQNNHSLVVRVDFGEASFLFTGDMEEEALETLVDYYHGTDMLDVDVWEVGHHGSHNGTTTTLLEAMTPDLAVISMGHWTSGQNSSSNFSTWRYGHPRIDTLRKLEAGVLGMRQPHQPPPRVTVFEEPRRMVEVVLSKAVYATGWDGTVTVTTDWDASAWSVAALGR